jgi:hypothetical protein
MPNPQEALAAHYGALTDEELLRVATHHESLVPVARAALADELRKRGKEGLISPILPAAEGKKRHGCLTVYLVFSIVVASACALFYLLANVQRFFPNAPGWMGPVYLVISLFQLVSSIALYQWKKWGFWVFCVCSAVAFGANLALGMGIVQSISGLLGILMLYGVLRIGGENEGWRLLE